MTALEDDDREALADLLMSDAVMFSDTMGRDYVYTEADAILAAGFRRPGPANSSEIDATGISPITDAQKHADELLAYVDYCLGLPMYQTVISEFGQGAVETLRMVKRTLTEGLHPDARDAVAPWLAPDADAKLAAWRAESPEDRATTFPSRGWRDYEAARNAS